LKFTSEEVVQQRNRKKSEIPKDSLGAVVITIGTELTYGERAINENKQWMCKYLFEKGIPVEVSLSLPDEADIIARWIRLFKKEGYSAIFISGGLGGTHDDQTREGIAFGLNVSLEKHERCEELLIKRYGDGYTKERKRMAMLPHGCTLIENSLGAPGFSIQNIYAFPGFPSMLQPMFTTIVHDFFASGHSEGFVIRDWVLPLSEHAIAEHAEKFTEKYPQCSVGLYPSNEKYGHEVIVRLRAPNKSTSAINEFDHLMENFLHQINVAYY